MRFAFLVGAGISVCGLLTACGTTPPPDYPSSWKPLNVYNSNVQEIPLVRPYQFYALPIDTTLKSLLERWASDSNVRLDYRHASDFSLSPEVRNIQESQLNDAVSKLDAVYAVYGVSVQMSGDRQIIVTAIPPVQPESKSKISKTRPYTRGK